MISSLANFQTLPLKDAARQFLARLGYKSDKFLVGAGSKPQDFLDHFAPGHPFDQAKALVPEWKSADLLFQLTDQELSRESALFTDTSVQRGLLKSYIFIAIELKDADYARGKFSSIARLQGIQFFGRVTGNGWIEAHRETQVTDTPGPPLEISRLDPPLRPTNGTNETTGEGASIGKPPNRPLRALFSCGKCGYLNPWPLPLRPPSSNSRSGPWEKS